jgi:hypothetical protein
VGIAVSVLTGATPLNGPPRGLANAATAYALNYLADEGARCCKRSVRRGLEAVGKFLDEKMNIRLKGNPAVKCRYIERNRECSLQDCPYFGKITPPASVKHTG